MMLKDKFAQFRPLFLPSVILIGSLLISILAVATEVDLSLRAYGLPLLPVNFNSNAVKGAVADSVEQEKTFTFSPTPTITLTSTASPTITPNPTQSAIPAACRQDCTNEKCPEALVCMAIASDNGIYSYQCLSPDCSPFNQDEICQCVTPTPREETIDL